MATETLTKRQAYVEVQTGTSASGATITARVNLGSLNKDAWDADKAFGIVTALSPCLAESIYAVPMVATYQVSQ